MNAPLLSGDALNDACKSECDCGADGGQPHVMGCQHTPAPWWFDANEGALRECLTGNFIASLEQPSTADARLIAAAPRMYEYIESSAANGCATAKAIMENIHANT